jgi:hypothetical protein
MVCEQRTVCLGWKEKGQKTWHMRKMVSLVPEENTDY